MIITRVFGGIGNQIFQYACGLATAYKYEMPLVIDARPLTSSDAVHNGFELSRVFDINETILSLEDAKKYLTWKNSRWGLKICQKYPKIQNKLPGNVFLLPEPTFRFIEIPHPTKKTTYLQGYWQSYKYFENIEHIVREKIIFKPITDKNNKEILTLIESEKSPISIHVRRGDYVDNKKNMTYHGICNINYYIKSISTITQKVPSASFFIFSDDPSWVKSELAPNINHPFTIVSHNTGHNSYLDMQLMSQCRHHIIANSSFSWWGAWLNPKKNKIVITPKKWFLAPINTDDLCPSTWLRI